MRNLVDGPIQAFTFDVTQATLWVAMDIDWHIGDVIAKLRKQRRMNQAAVAAKVGVNKATIVRAEAGDGKVSRATFLKIAEVLKTDMAALEGEAARLQGMHPDPNRKSGVSGSHTSAAPSSESLEKRDGPNPALVSPVPNAQVITLPSAKRKGGRLRAIARDTLAAAQQAEAVDTPPTRTPRQPAPTAGTRTTRDRVRDRKLGR